MDTVLLEKNRVLTHFIKQQHISEELFLQRILVRYRDVIRLHPEKIKTVPGARYKSRLVFEFKLAYDAFRTFRIAFIKCDGNLVVIFASNQIKKKEFTKELKKTSLVD